MYGSVMSRYVIELEGVTVRKGGRTLLKRISFGVPQGECVGIIGPNGAGKTTLLNVIAGFERFAGKLSLFGRRESWKLNRRTRLRIGYVPQRFQVDPAFPILAFEAVVAGSIGRLGLFRSPGRQEKERAMQLMEMMRMAHCADRPLGHLSGGERQKALLARAIMQEPDVLLLDEPTANLDIAVQKEFMDLISEIYSRQGLTILLVTHDFNMLPASLRRAVLLNHGETIFDGDVDRAMSGEILSRLFQYPLETFDRNGKRFVSYD